MNDIINIQGVECFEKDGVAYLKLETVARGLGFTKRRRKAPGFIHGDISRLALSC